MDRPWSCSGLRKVKFTKFLQSAVNNCYVSHSILLLLKQTRKRQLNYLFCVVVGKVVVTWKSHRLPCPTQINVSVILSALWVISLTIAKTPPPTKKQQLLHETSPRTAKRCVKAGLTINYVWDHSQLTYNNQLFVRRGCLYLLCCNLQCHFP